MQKHIELAKKLKALADRGVGGEKVNAETMLQNLMQKHGLTMADIDGEIQKNYFFKLESDEMVSLWQQIVASVNWNIKFYGEFKKSVIKQHALDGNWAVKCTAAEFAEISCKFSVYGRLYQQEKKVFYNAFIHANDLLIDRGAGNNKSVDDLSPKEREDYMRASQMAESIKKENYRKQLSKTNQ